MVVQISPNKIGLLLQILEDSTRPLGRRIFVGDRLGIEGRVLLRYSVVTIAILLLEGLNNAVGSAALSLEDACTAVFLDTGVTLRATYLKWPGIAEMQILCEARKLMIALIHEAAVVAQRFGTKRAISNSPHACSPNLAVRAPPADSLCIAQGTTTPVPARAASVRCASAPRCS